MIINASVTSTATTAVVEARTTLAVAHLNMEVTAWAAPITAGEAVPNAVAETAPTTPVARPAQPRRLMLCPARRNRQ